MKRIPDKHSKMSKLIAFWLVFVMMATPFFAHAGLPNDTKADEMIVDKDNPVETSEFKFGSIFLDISELCEMSSEDSVILKSQSTEKEYKYYNINWFYFPEILGINIKNSILEDGTKVNITAPKIKYRVYDSGATIEDTITDETLLKNTVSMTPDKILVAYLKLKGTAVKGGNSTDFETDYVRYCTYKFTETEPFTGNFNCSYLDDSGVSISNDKFYTNFNLKITDRDTVDEYIDNNADAIGYIKYNYQVQDVNFQGAKLIGDTVTINLDTASCKDKEGEVKVSLEYHVPGADGSDTIVKTVTLPGTVPFDRKAPSSDTDGTGLFDVTENKKLDIDTSTREDADSLSKFIYYYKGQDSVSGIEKVELYKGTTCLGAFTKDSESGIYSLKPDQGMVYDESDTEELTIRAYDAAGNCDICEVPKLLKLDMTKKDIDISFGENEEALSTVPDVGITAPLKTNTQYLLKYKVTSYQKPSKVSITYADDTSVKEESVSYENEEIAGGYYLFEGSFRIPAASENAEYKNVKLVVDFADNGHVEKPVVSEILYDNTTPSFVFHGTEEEFTVPDEWNPLFSSAFDVISGAGNVESDIVEAYYDGGTKFDLTITDGKVSEASINADNISASTDSRGTPVKLYARDEAGNEYNKTVYYKKDTLVPVISSLYFLREGESTNDGPVNDEYMLWVVGRDNIGIDRAEFRVKKSDGSYGTEPDGEINDIVNQGWSLKNLDKNQEHTVKVTVYDFAGNSVEEEKAFYLDCTAPCCDVETNTVLQVKGADDAWTDVSNSPNSEGIYCIDSDKEYRCKVVVEDEHKLLQDKAVNIDIEGYDENPAVISEFDSANADSTRATYYISIDKTKLLSDEGRELRFTVKDKAGNESGVYAFKWPLKLIDKELKINATLHTIDENGVDKEITVQELPGFRFGTNKSLYVVVHLSSAQKLDKDSIVLVKADGSSIAAGTVIASNLTDVDNEGRYNCSVRFDLPADTNIFFPGIRAKGSEEGSGASKEVNLADILYDKTTPELKTISGEEFTLTRSWSYKVSGDIVVTSGNSSIIESELDEVWYTINGGDRNDIAISADRKQAGGQVIIDLSSVTTNGTKVRIYARDKAGNVTEREYAVWVDNKRPEITGIVINNNITEVSNPVTGIPVIKATVNDNLTIKTIRADITYPDNTVKTKTFNYTETVDAEVNGGNKEVSFAIEKITQNGAGIPDGTYTVKVYAEDCAGNKAAEITKTFRVDNTRPVVTSQVNSGAASVKSDEYYKSEVGVMLTYCDDNMNSNDVTVTDNGKAVNLNWSATADSKGRYIAYYNTSEEGKHVIKITAADKAGNKAEPSTVTFYIDRTSPVLSTVINGGMIYTDSTGMLYMTGNVNLSVGVSDTNEDVGDLNYQLIYTKPNGEKTTNLYKKTSDRNFVFGEEGEYVINLFAIDKAMNYSRTRTITFRIDKNAPSLSINGAGQGTHTSNVNVSMNMKEAFWKDASGEINIYRKPGDGQSEVLFKTINVTPTSADMSIAESFTETGVYRIEFAAEDRTGHSANTSAEFILDKDAPEVNMAAPDNYYKTKDEVSISFEISDVFYLGKEIDLKGTRTDASGKVHQLDFGKYNASASQTVISSTFTEDGIYDISLTVRDQAGNSESRELHFTIDKTEPQIADISYLDGKTINSFSWDEDLDELISDLTVCDIKMYLNGSEYDGKSDIEDGSYTLLITATDELGNTTEKEVKFILDTKAPVFIITGVEENQVQNEEYNINISLQLAEDTLSSVTLNGKEMSINGNSCSFTVKDKGSYTLVMTATDEAGNEATYELEFKYGQESTWYIWAIIAAIIVIVAAIILIIVKKKKSK